MPSSYWFSLTSSEAVEKACPCEARAYAAENQMEYFAEGTEAYFYRNDFYPFVGAELKLHDPVLYDLLVEIWGPVE